MLPDPKIKDRIANLCVGLAANCDAPESDVDKVMRDNLKGASQLPFVAFVTSDLQWVGGFAGFKSVDEFDAALTAAEKSPVLDAKPETTKKLEGLAAQAAKAAEKSDWKSVFAASKAAHDLKGRSPVRGQIAASVKKARDWADGELAKAFDSAKAGGDRNPLRAALTKLSAAFAGEPEQKDADAGLKAISKLTTIETLAAEQQDAARTKAAKDFAGTRWAALFEKK